jgi:hypothetical protein
MQELNWLSEEARDRALFRFRHQDQSMVNAGGFCRSLDSSHGEEYLSKPLLP